MRRRKHTPPPAARTLRLRRQQRAKRARLAALAADSVSDLSPAQRETLALYSQGKISSTEAKADLGLDRRGLIALVAGHRLQLPHIDRERAEEMAREALETIGFAPLAASAAPRRMKPAHKPALTGALRIQAMRQRRLRRTARARLASLALLYSSAAISWREVREETGIAFGELLAELARQRLQLPQVSAAKSPEQSALFDETLRQAAANHRRSNEA